MATRAGSLLRAFFLAVVLFAPLSAAGPVRADENQSGGDQAPPSVDEVAGQVVGINTLAPRPLVQVANLDGTVNLYFLSVDLIVMAGVRYGDHISALGRKISELEFEVDEVRVDFRGTASQDATTAANDPIVADWRLLPADGEGVARVGR
jgi:hypothetical protein